MDAGISYWSDFRLIRESRKITLHDIHSVTKIPISVLREFETDGLESNAQLNQVYRRSLVAAYAKAVGVDPKLAKRSVSTSSGGAYDGLLARAYLLGS